MSLILCFVKDLGDSWRCSFTSNWSVLTVHCYWKAGIILSLSKRLFQLPNPVPFLVMAQMLGGPFMELIQPINLIEKVSTFFHRINCLPGSAMNWLMEKSDGYQDWWKVLSARVEEAGAGSLSGNSELNMSCVTSPWSCSLMICRLWQSWPSPFRLFMYQKFQGCFSFRIVFCQHNFQSHKRLY